jgi:putative membrane protein
MNLYPKNKLPLANVKRFIVIFYIVGIVGFIIPFTKEIFINITPLALILNAYLLAIYHKKYNAKDIFIFLLILILGFFIEVVGVNTGLVFGSYNYGSALGMMLFNTPVIIGVNWLFLTYVSTSVSENLKFKKWSIIAVAPLFMLIYDIVLEQVAPKMDMWNWQNSNVPLKNYVSWYLAGVCFVLLLKIFKIETRNPLASLLFICQFVFFVFLTFFL